MLFPNGNERDKNKDLKVYRNEIFYLTFLLSFEKELSPERKRDGQKKVLCREQKAKLVLCSVRIIRKYTIYFWYD